MKTTGFDSILCPVDFSDYSVRALRYAAELAGSSPARITALSVLPNDPAFSGGDLLYVLPQTPIAARLEVAKRDLQAFVAEHADRPVACIVDAGVPARSIALHAERIGADLIVMGTHGLSGMERLMLGSVTESVLRRAPCPVLTFNHRFAQTGGRGVILCPVSIAPQQSHIAQALALAEAWQAQLEVVHVIEGVSGVTDSGTDRAAGSHLLNGLAVMAPNGIQHTSLITSGDAADEVLRLAAERHADLIVVGVHERSPLDLLFLGSTITSVIRGAGCPVLTVRSQYRSAVATVPAPQPEQWQTGGY